MHWAKIGFYIWWRHNKTSFFRRTFADFSRKHGTITVLRLSKTHDFSHWLLQFFTRDGNAISGNYCCLTCKFLCVAMQHLLKNYRKIETLSILVIYLSASFAIALWDCVAWLQFFPHDGNTINFWKLYCNRGWKISRVAVVSHCRIRCILEISKIASKMTPWIKGSKEHLEPKKLSSSPAFARFAFYALDI